MAHYSPDESRRPTKRNIDSDFVSCRSKSKKIFIAEIARDALNFGNVSFPENGASCCVLRLSSKVNSDCNHRTVKVAQGNRNGHIKPQSRKPVKYLICPLTFAPARGPVWNSVFTSSSSAYSIPLCSHPVKPAMLPNLHTSNLAQSHVSGIFALLCPARLAACDG